MLTIPPPADGSPVNARTGYTILNSHTGQYSILDRKMPSATRKSNSTRSHTSRRSSKRSSTSSKKSSRTTRLSPTRTVRKRSTVRSTGTRIPHSSSLNPEKLPSSSATFVFECTRQGCGYRTFREERADEGQLRFDIKCPKCHNEEFRCLGKGDYGETSESPNNSTFDFDFSQQSPLGSANSN